MNAIMQKLRGTYKKLRENKKETAIANGPGRRCVWDSQIQALSVLLKGQGRVGGGDAPPVEDKRGHVRLCACE